ncbi:MAG: AMP-binding protein [Acidimicrobiales bacterium]
MQGVTGSGLSPFGNRDVSWLWESKVREHSERQWLVWRDLDGDRRQWTYGEFFEDVCNSSAGLAELGVEEGSRVVLFAENCPDFLLTWFATLRLGAVMVSVNARYKPAELADALRRVDPAVVMTSVALLPVVRAALDRLREQVPSGQASRYVPPHLLIADVALQEPYGAGELARGLSSLLGRSLGPEARAGSNPAGLLAPAGIQFTSGTTAQPKAVVWTQTNYLWGGKVSASHEDLHADDRHLVHLPLFHTNAQIYSVMASLWAGASVILVPRFSASRFWQVAVEERATWCSMVPFTVKALRRSPVPAHSIRRFGNSVIVPSWDRYFRVSTVAWWGMTETVTHPIVSDPSEEARPLAMGTPACEYQVRVLGDDGVPVRDGSGLLEVRGVQGISLALGYLDDPAATAATWDEEGWMRTGDRVEVHEDGWLSFLERAGDMLKVGGENVAALEVERVIRTVRGVEEVAVVGAPDAMLDEVPVAFVLVDSALGVADRSAVRDQIELTCKSELSSFKVPKDVYVVDELPRATLEKVAKAELRKLARTLRGERDDA